MTTYCSILAWKIPWIEEPGGLQSTGLQKVGHDWVIKQAQILMRIQHTQGFPVDIVEKNPPTGAEDARDSGSITGFRRSTWVGNGNQSCILAWRIPWAEEPGGLQSIGSQRVGHDWGTNTFNTYGYHWTRHSPMISQGLFPAWCGQAIAGP